MFWGSREHKRGGINPLQRETFPFRVPPGLHPRLARPQHPQNRAGCCVLGNFGLSLAEPVPSARGTPRLHPTVPPLPPSLWIKAGALQKSMATLPSRSRARGPRGTPPQCQLGICDTELPEPLSHPRHELNHVQHAKSTKNAPESPSASFLSPTSPILCPRTTGKNRICSYFVFSELPVSWSFSAASGQALGKPKPGAHLVPSSPS